MSDKGDTVDFGAITAAQKETWDKGDFHQIARQNVCIAEALCEAVDPHADDRVLDIACGSGTAALVAARRYCKVTGLDYVPALIERAKQRAMADDLDIEFKVGDAQSLPFSDGYFNAVLSVYGVQFAPNQEQAAREMLRVCRPGGKIGLATPVPEGWSGDFLRQMPSTCDLPQGSNLHCTGELIRGSSIFSVKVHALSTVRNERRCSTTGLLIML